MVKDDLFEHGSVWDIGLEPTWDIFLGGKKTVFQLL